MGDSTPPPPGRVICCALLPHAPILVPGVGGIREGNAAASISAIREAARRVVAMQPDAVVVLSPHSPRVPESFAIWTGRRLQGSLRAFGFPERTVNLPADGAFADGIASVSAGREMRIVPINQSSLDHGAVVPLWFLAEAGWRGPSLVLGLNALGRASCVALAKSSPQRRPPSADASR